MTLRRLVVALAAILLVMPGAATAQDAAPSPARPAAPAKPAIDVSTLQRDSSGNVVFNREVFSYPRSGRRDPFASLITTGDMRPLVQDLEVVGIILAGANSVATLKDISTGEVYRVRNGSMVGRIRVSAIRQREVALSIDEFGFTRQEVLSLNVPSRGGRTP